MKTSKISWKEGSVPLSEGFDDVYFSKDDGLAESTYVFLDGIGAPSCWNGKSEFVIGETGFGTGLNFLLTWQAFSKTRKKGQRLHFISLEGFPMALEDLEKAHSAFKELSPYARKLRDAYPVLHPGYHLFEFDQGSVSLTLILLPAQEALCQLSASVDAWYLDGFAPGKNPEMWTPALFGEIARLSKPHAKLATFTAAGFVRRGLAEVGFDMKKAPGFGRKRECLRGTFTGPEARPPKKALPWYHRPKAQTQEGKVAIVGAGIAGLLAADRLEKKGFSCTVFDRNEEVALGASGNPAGLIEPKLTAKKCIHGRFHANGFLHAKRLYDALERLGHSVWHSRNGLLAAARHEMEVDHHRRLAENPDWPEDALRALTSSEATKRTGIALPHGGLWYDLAGCVKPRTICNALARDKQLRLGVDISTLEKNGALWTLKAADGTDLFSAPIVVLAGGPFVPRLLGDRTFPVYSNRGQISFFKDLPNRFLPNRPLTLGSYLINRFGENGALEHHLLGATFGRWNDLTDPGWAEVTAEDHQKNIQNLDEHLEGFANEAPFPVGGRASLRATTSDYLPLVGPVHDETAFLRDYSDLHHGKKPSFYPEASWEKGLYAFCGLGSRGLQSAPLSAEILAAHISGSPMPVEWDIVEALMPARFLVRELKKGKKTNLPDPTL